MAAATFTTEYPPGGISLQSILPRKLFA